MCGLTPREICDARRLVLSCEGIYKHRIKLLHLSDLFSDVRQGHYRQLPAMLEGREHVLTDAKLEIIIIKILRDIVCILYLSEKSWGDTTR